MIDSDGNFYSGALLTRMIAALETIRLQRLVSWENYGGDMCTVLKVSKRNLNENDPRHWVRNGHSPSPERLLIYRNYIAKITDNKFDFSQGWEVEYRNLGNFLARFSLPQLDKVPKEILADVERVSHITFYAGRRDRQTNQLDGLDIFQLRRVRNSPYLTFSMVFHSTPPNVESSDNSLEWILESISYEHSIEETGKEIEPTESVSVKYVRTGIFCATSERGLYHGIIKTDDYDPTHAILRVQDNIEGTSDFRNISLIEENELARNFQVSLRAYDLKNLFDQIGEPLI